MSDKWITDFEVRGIKKVKVEKWFSETGIEHKTIKCIDKNDDVHLIRISLDEKDGESSD